MSNKYITATAAHGKTVAAVAAYAASRRRAEPLGPAQARAMARAEKMYRQVSAGLWSGYPDHIKAARAAIQAAAREYGYTCVGY